FRRRRARGRRSDARPAPPPAHRAPPRCETRAHPERENENHPAGKDPARGRSQTAGTVRGTPREGLPHVFHGNAPERGVRELRVIRLVSPARVGLVHGEPHILIAAATLYYGT